VKGKSYDISREKMADRYLFEMYQNMEFFRSCIAKAKHNKDLWKIFYLFGLSKAA
jgi:hypothetical protein